MRLRMGSMGRMGVSRGELGFGRDMCFPVSG